MTIEVRLLGVVEATRGVDVLAIGGGRQRRLLAHLALMPGRPRTTESVIEALWPDGTAPTDVRQSVHTAVSRLRTALSEPGSVVARGGGYVLEGVSVDATRFADLLKQARGATDDDEAVICLGEALDLWRGAALEEFAHEEWARVDAVRLDELRAHASDEFGEALLRLGRFDEAVVELEAAAVRSPLRERTHRQLMDALDASGRTAEALRVFHDYRHRLATDLGLEPSESIRVVDAAIAEGTRAHLRLPSRSARTYELGEQIGSGAFSIVYRGRQPTVERDVAVKVIRSELADRPEFVERFEAEAQLVARLEHPHIVPLYDFWREPGKAYLVMRLLRGGSLESRLRKGPLDADSVVRFLRQIGAALEAAHQFGVVHRDVRPANILCDDEGNFYLADFGIATGVALARNLAVESSGETPSRAGSPAYSSPEQLRGEPAGPRSDLFAFAVCVFEAVTGRLPFHQARTLDGMVRSQLEDPLPSVHALRADMPAAADDVLGIATAKVPALRYGSVAEFVAEALRVLQPDAVAEIAPTRHLEANPYKGLRSFVETDTADFVGRERLINELVGRTVAFEDLRETPRFLALVGPSGSGKSSVVRAGLVPALRTLGDGRSRLITTMTPGAHPFEELAVALGRISTASGRVAIDDLARPRGLVRAIKTLTAVGEADFDAHVLVVVDQFEELFTMTDVSERTAFLDQLAEVVEENRLHATVIVTLRADFFDHALTHPGLTRILGHGTMPVGALSDDELVAAITVPAERAGATFEPGLVDAIKREAMGEPGALPLLQHALAELFDRHENGTLTHEAFVAIGGLEGSIASRAEQLLVDDDDSDAVRRIFIRLVRLGDGVEDTRRRARRAELPASPRLDALLDSFGAARLLTFDRDPVTREPTVEVAHEALITSWPRLRGWLNDDRDNLRSVERLRVAAESWERAKRDPSELYRGARLELATQRLVGHEADLNDSEGSFLDASKSQADLERSAAFRTARRIKRSLVGVACFAVAAVVAGSLAWRSGQASDRSARRAETARLAASAPALAQTNLSLGLLAAAESYQRDRTPETLGALQRALISQERILGFLGTGRAYAAVDVNETTVFGLRDGFIDRFELATLKELKPIPIPVRLLPEYTVAQRRKFSVGGDVALVRYADMSSVLVTFGGTVTELPKSWVGIVSPDGDQLALVHMNLAVELFDTDGARRVWKTAAPKEQTYGDQSTIAGPPLAAPPQTPLVAEVAFAPNGDILNNRGHRFERLAASDGHVAAEFAKRFLLNTIPNQPPNGGLGGVSGTAWMRPDGDYVVSGGMAAIGRWKLDDPTTMSMAFTWLANPFGTGLAADIAPLDERRGVVARNDGTVIEVDFTTGDQIGAPIDSQVGLVRSIAVTPSRRRVVVGGESGIAIISLNGDRLLARAFASRPGPGFSAGAATKGGWRTIIDTAPQLGETAPPAAEGFCPTDTALECRELASREGLRSEAWWALRDRIALWDRVADRVSYFQQDSDQIAATSERIGWAVGPIINPLRGPWVAAVTTPKVRGPHRIRVADLRTGKELAVIEGPGPGGGWDGFASPGGRDFVLVNRNTGDSQSVNTTTWTIDQTAVFPPGTAISGLFDRTGKRVLTAARDGTMRIWSWPQIRILRQFAADNSLSNPWAGATSEFFDDQRYVVTTFDSRGRLWDLDSGQPVGAPFPGTGEAVAAAEVPALFTHIRDKYGLIWDLDTSKWFDLACAAAGRNMSRLEWERNGPRDKEYRATCPQWKPAPS